MKQTLYQVLGVPENADAATIKNAFRKLAKKYHPDVNIGNEQAEIKFKEAPGKRNIAALPQNPDRRMEQQGRRMLVILLPCWVWRCFFLISAHPPAARFPRTSSASPVCWCNSAHPYPMRQPQTSRLPSARNQRARSYP